MRFLAAFALVALAEVATFFWVGSKVGLIWALALAVATALIGAFLVRRAGLSALSRIRLKVNQGRLPGRELIEGAAILVSGAFLISPGFITDVLGVLLLIPAVRALLHTFLTRWFSARMTVFAANRQTLRRNRSGSMGSTGGWGDDVVDVIDVDSLE